MIKLLFIDPDAQSNKYMSFYYKKLGYEVITTTNGKEGLVEAYRDPPQIILIDPTFNDIPVDELMEKFRRDKRTSNSKIIALSSLDQTADIQFAIDQNFDKFITKGPDVLKILTDVITKLTSKEEIEAETVLKKISGSLYSDHNLPQHSNQCKTIVFLSAKGGTGTSTICANTASMFAKLKPEAKIAMIDLVLPIGSIAPIVGAKEGVNIVQASLMPSAEIGPGVLGNKLTYLEKWGFHLLPGSTKPEEAQKIDISRIPLIIESLKSEFDYLFIDIGTSLSRISLPVILHSNQAIIILGLDQATVTITKNVIDFLNKEGQDRKTVFPLINRAVGLEGLPKREVDEIIGYEITGNIPYIRENFSLANNSNLPIHEKFPDNIVAIALREISTKIFKRMESNTAK